MERDEKKPLKLPVPNLPVVEKGAAEARDHAEMDSEGADPLGGGQGQSDSTIAEPRPQAAPGQTPGDEDPEQLVGKLLGHRYRIKRCIGIGGMGVVYLAAHEQLNRDVVVKTIRRSKVSEDSHVKRFEREALGLSQLDHPNIVTIYDFGHEDDISYIVMEYVDGQTLREFMKKRGRLSMSDFGPIAIQILEALGEAHQHTVIHRDIKPSNIMVSRKKGEDNFVKVLDFGLAKLLLDDGADVTKQDSIVGSVAYMAPEHIQGKEVGTRADVYALGVLFYHMLAGRKPFEGEDLAVLYQHVHEEARPLESLLAEHHDIAPGVIELIHRCLEKDPDNRPADALVMAELLREAVESSEIFTRPWLGTGGSSSSRYRRFSTDGSGSYSGTYRPTVTATDASGSVSRSIESQAEATKPWVLPVVVGVFVALFALIGFIAMNRGDGTESSAEQGGTAQAAGSDDPAQRLQQTFDRVEQLIGEGRFQQAAMILESTNDALGDHPDHLERAAQLRVNIDIARLTQQATAHVEQGRFDEAITTYRELLSQDGSNEAAREEIARIEAFPVVVVESQPAATLWINGDRRGDTPATYRLAPGEYAIELTATGYTPWTKTIALAEGDRERMSAQLRQASAPAPAPAAPQARPTPRPRPASTAPVAATKQAETTTEQPEASKRRRQIDLLVPVDQGAAENSTLPLKIGQ